MRIIIAKERHLPEIIELWKELMDSHRVMNNHWSRRKDGHIKYEEFLREMIKSKNAIVLVATENKRVIGYSNARKSKLSLTRENDVTGEINAMMVDEEYRRKGIGEQLLKRTCEWFEAHKINRIELSVATNNQIGYSFWNKHGFRDFCHILYKSN